jgi:hypothetical protein
LLLLFRGTHGFQQHVPDEKRRILAGPLAGVMEPKVVNDTQFLSVRVAISEGHGNDIELKSTQPYDELVDLLNVLNFSELEYETPADLQRHILHTCSAFVSPLLVQKLTPELLTETAEVQENVVGNHVMLKRFSERVCSALFAARNEGARLESQLNSLFEILARSAIVPSLIEQYPLDFIVKEENIFQPDEASSRIIWNVTCRIDSFEMTEESEQIVKKTFFLDFLDRIDRAFDFQKRIKTDRFPHYFGRFCQQNSQVATQLSPQRLRVLSRSAKAFQWVRCVHPISYNLYVALKALHPLSIFTENAAAMALAMSGNGDVPGFVHFINKYMRESRLENIILSEPEKALIANLRKAQISVICDRPGQIAAI